MSIPSIIKQQLIQTNIIIVGSWGTSNWAAISDTTLAFRVHARRLDGIICITLDKASDSYNISFFKNKSFTSLSIQPKEKFKQIEGVYFDQLVDLIDKVIEKIPEYSH